MMHILYDDWEQIAIKCIPKNRIIYFVSESVYFYDLIKF